MRFVSSTTKRSVIWTATTALLVFILLIIDVGPATSQPANDTISDLMLQAENLRFDQELAAAAELYQKVIDILLADTDQRQLHQTRLKDTYNELLYTAIQLDAERQTSMADSVARKALAWNPRTNADDFRYNTDLLNQVYDRHRAKMFGSIHVTVQKPDEATVKLDGKVIDEVDEEGKLLIDFVPVGKHELEIAKDKHKSDIQVLDVAGGAPNTVTTKLERNKDWFWWSVRVVPAAVGAVIVALLIGEDDKLEPPPDNPEPIEPPPGPPTSSD